MTYTAVNSTRCKVVSRAMLVSGRVTYMDPSIITGWSATDKLQPAWSRRQEKAREIFDRLCSPQLLWPCIGMRLWGRLQSRIQRGQPVKLCAIPNSNCLGCFRSKQSTDTRYKNGKDARIRRDMK